MEKSARDTIGDHSGFQGIEYYWAFTGVFWSVVSLTMAGLILISRSGLGSPMFLIFSCLSVFMSAAFCPFLLPSKIRTGFFEKPFKLCIIILLVFLSPLLAFLAGQALAFVYPALALAGLAGSLRHLKIKSKRDLVFLAAAPPLTAAYFFTTINNLGYATVFAPEQALLGTLNQDTYFHLTLSQMIRNYHSVTTGLDGLAPLKYHIGSHCWFSAMSILSGADMVFAYPMGYMIVAVPGLFMALLAACLAVARSRQSLTTYYLCTLALVFISGSISALNLQYCSESQTFGITTLLLLLPLLFDLVKTPRRTSGSDFARLATAVTAIFLLSSLKVSIGFLWALTLGYTLVRAYGFSLRNFAALSAILALTGLSVTAFNYPANRALQPVSSLLSLLLLNSHAPLPYLPDLFIPGLLLVLAYYSLPVRTAAGIIDTLRTKSLLEMEVFLVLLAAGFLPAFLPNLSIVDSWYFYSMPQWAAIPLIFSFLSISTVKKKLADFNLARIAAAGLLFVISFELFQNRAGLGLGYLQFARDMAASLDQSGGNLLLRGRSPDAFFRDSLVREKVLFGADFSRLINQSLMARTVSLIRDKVGKAPEGFAVFVPPENGKFWKLTDQCLAKSWMIPSLAGVPMILGLPPQEFKCKLVYFGYDFYRPDQRTRGIGDRELCEHALTRDIHSVLVISDIDHPGANKLLACGGK